MPTGGAHDEHHVDGEDGHPCWSVHARRPRPHPRGEREAGVPSFWLVDPDDGVVTVLELVDGAYREQARGAQVTVEQPFPVTVRLSR